MVITFEQEFKYLHALATTPRTANTVHFRRGNAMNSGAPYIRRMICKDQAGLHDQVLDHEFDAAEGGTGGLQAGVQP